MVLSHLPQPVASANAPIQGAPGVTDASSGEWFAEGAAFDCALDSVCTPAPRLDETVPEVSTQAGVAIMSDWWLSLGSEPPSAIDEDTSDDEDEDGKIAEDAARNLAAVITADIQALPRDTPPVETQSPEPWAATSSPGFDRAISGVDDLTRRETADARHDAEQARESAQETIQPVNRDAVSRHVSRQTAGTETASTASVAASEVGQTASREHAPAEVIEKVPDLRPAPSAMADTDMARAGVAPADRDASTDDASAAVRAAAQRMPAAATGMASSAARTGNMPTASTPLHQNAAQLPAAAAPLPERTAAVPPTASVVPAAHTGHDLAGILATDQDGDGQVEIEEQHPVQTAAAAATITGPGAASQGRQDFSGTERQASQENPPAATRFAGAAPMTLVVAPDGTFRLTPAAATFILPP